MDTNTFVKWLFRPKDSDAIPSPSVSQPTSTTKNDHNQAAENDVNEELKRLDLQGSCLNEVEENGTRGVAGEEAKEVEEAKEEETQDENGTEKEDKHNKEEACGEPVENDTKYPVRPGADDCLYYMRTRTCKFGSSCKFNHPIEVPWRVQAGKEEFGHGEAAQHHSGQVECKYYLSPGGCKFGKACKFSHSKTRELNFLGLPIRPGEQECMYFMRTGTCKYAATCKFNHPDPTNTSGGDNPKLPMEYNSSSSTLEIPSSPLRPQFPASATSWSSPAESKSEWNNAYQFPVNQAGHSNNIAPPLTYPNHHHHHQMVMNDYPERPGQPECTYFMRNGDCKFKSNCMFHHPKERISKSPHDPIQPATASFSNHGFSNQNICTHYRRYGICRFGPSCKFNHRDDPVSGVSRSQSMVHQQSSTSRPHVISL